MPPEDFDARAYWEQRLTDDYSLTGVGFRRLGPSFNRWAYQVRKARFDDAVGRLALDIAGSNIVDVGSGTGFYVDQWLQRGARVTGLDLTDSAVRRLREEYPPESYPKASFEQGDIADTLLLDRIGVGAIDLVSAMDVLFHIVEDAAYQRALANISALLRPGGFLLYSDFFVHGKASRVAHRVSRPLGEVAQKMDDVGLEIVERRPFFYLMNDPMDGNRLLRAAWYAAASVVSSSDRVGQFVGKRIYPLELRLTATRSESPTTELMVCRRR
jgi:SAM-dependent methyltransferase